MVRFGCAASRFASSALARLGPPTPKARRLCEYYQPPGFSDKHHRTRCAFRGFRGVLSRFQRIGHPISKVSVAKERRSSVLISRNDWQHHFPLLVAAWFSLSESVPGQGTAFTCQGQLSNAGQPANGSYDLRATLYSAATGGVQAGPTITNLAVTVSGGFFTTGLDFGPGIFQGAPRWLELAVRPAGGGAFTLLSPRQTLTPTPYALYAMTPAGSHGPMGAPGPVESK